MLLTYHRKRINQNYLEKVLVTTGKDGSFKVWDTNSGTELSTHHPHNKPLKRVNFSPDGKWLATASEDKTVKIWEVADGEELLTLYGHLDAANEVAFSPDGKRLATTGADGVVIVHTIDISELMDLARTRLEEGDLTEETIEVCKKYLREDSCPIP